MEIFDCRLAIVDCWDSGRGVRWNMLAVFVWTFNGVMQAIGLGLMLLTFAVIGLLVAWVKLLGWCERRNRSDKR